MTDSEDRDENSSDLEFTPDSRPYDPLFDSLEDVSREPMGFDADDEYAVWEPQVSYLLQRARPEDELVWTPPVQETFQSAAAPGWQTGSAYYPPITAGTTSAGAIAIPRRPSRWLVTTRELLETLLLALLIFFAVRASFQNFRVEGASMEPSLRHGEFIIVNKLSYAEVDLSIFNWLPFFEADGNSVQHLWDSPDRGDVIVFRSPTSINRDFIKRVIGLPGDTIVINEGTGEVSVNGTSLTEPYIQGTTNCNVSCTRVIPAPDSPEAMADCGSNRCYFVLGDNRQNSSDSRQGWLVPEENIIGKALITYWHDGSLDLGLAPNKSVQVADPVSAEE